MWGADQKIERGLRRRLVRLASKNTIQTPEWVSEFVTERVRVAYEMGELEPLGFDPAVPMNEISSNHIRQLGTIGERLAHTVNMLEHSYDLYRSADLWGDLEALYSKIQMRDRARDITTEILNLHDLPSIPALLIDGKITLQDIPHLRCLPEVRDYRAWLWEQRDPSAAKDVKQAYLAALDRHIKVTDTRWYKAANLTTMTGVGFYLGLVTAPMGSIAGGLAGSVTGTGISVATNRIAAKLSEKPDPTRFATVIDHIRAKSKADVSSSP